MASSSSSSQSCSYHVFLSFRGEDTRKTFVDHCYSALVGRTISTYKDDETLPRGESIGPSLIAAIKASQIAVIIFSKNYGDSSWCLDELAYIMKCKDKRGLIVMPIFYDVVPSEVRKQEGDFGIGFGKQLLKNKHKVESWSKALVDASDNSGWEVKNTANGHEAKVIQEIADTISKKLFSVDSFVDEGLVGMSTRLQQLEEQLGIGSEGVRMVGVWGLGGSGKTTITSSLYMNISCRFQCHCIIENVREESKKRGLKALQEILLSTLLKTKMKLQSVVEGKHMIGSRLNRSNVLILLDDVDDLSQLNALVGSHNWFGSGSRIIITTRDQHLLITHNVDLVCPVTLLSHEEAVMLFNKHAYNKGNCVNGYKKLSSDVVSYAAGLPLALKVLGSFLYDKNEKEWLSSLSRLKDIPEMEIVEKLRISYDGLKTVEKELFLDIACFFRGSKAKEDDFYGGVIDNAMEVFEACGYYPDIGIKVLQQKALITIVDGKFDMHDLVQEMGHYIVRGEHPNSPERHSRVWKREEIKNIYLKDTTTDDYKIEAMRHFMFPEGHLSLISKIVSNMKKLRYLTLSPYFDKYDQNFEGPNFLSNELRYINWCNYSASPFPDNFQPMKLVILKLNGSLQNQLWRDYKHLPHFKVLELSKMDNLLRTPNFDGLPSLQKLTIQSCHELQEIHPSLGQHTSLEYHLPHLKVLELSLMVNLVSTPNFDKLPSLQKFKLYRCYELEEIHPSLGKHTSLEYVWVSMCDKLRMFPTIVDMRNLKTLHISWCHKSMEFPVIRSSMESLVELSLKGIDALLPSIGYHCPNLTLLSLDRCPKIKEVNLAILGSLRKLVLSSCRLKDGEIPYVIGELSNLRELDLSDNDFTRLDFSLSQLTRLKLLGVSYCKRLVELPKLPSGLVNLRADCCFSLTTLGDFYTDCKWLSRVSLMGRGVKTDGNGLLQSMIEGNVIPGHFLNLGVKGLEIAKGFRPRLVKGRKFRLELPENWFNDFSGFLVCTVEGGDFIRLSPSIIMEEVSGMDYEDDVADWEESDDDKRSEDSEDDMAEWEESVYDKTSVVWYVPFSPLRNTKWWNSSTHKELFFTIKNTFISGLAVKLVARKSQSNQLETLTTLQEEESESSNYAHVVIIEKDSRSALTVVLFNH